MCRLVRSPGAVAARSRLVALQPFLAEFNATGGIHVEQPDRSTPLGRQAHYLTSAEHEIIAPDILTGMEQGNDCARSRIDTRKVWSFVRVATIAGESKVVWIIGPTVLLRYNMLDVEGNEGRRFLRDAAVFTSVASTPSDKPSRACIHVLRGLLCEKPPRFCLNDRNHIDGFNEILVFCILRSRQCSLVRLPAQVLNVSLEVGICTEIEKSRCDLWRERVGQRFQ